MASNIIDVYVNGQRIQVEGAASEATLQEISRKLDELNKNSQKTSGSTKNSRSSGGRKSTPGSDNESSIERMRREKAEEDAEGAVGGVENFDRMVEKASKNNLQSFMSGLTSAASGLVNFGTDLLTGGNRIDEVFGNNLPVIGDYVGSLASLLAEYVDTFRELSSVGASFNNSLANMRLSAAKASLPLDDFKNLVVENSTTIALLGKNMTQATKRFSNFSKQIREGKIGQNLMGMGVTMQSLNEYLVDYLEIQARLGHEAKLRSREEKQESSEYIKQLDLLAKTTGQTREQMSQAIKAQTEEARVRSLMANATEENSMAVASNLAFLSEQTPNLANAFSDLADGVPQTQEAMQMVSLGGRKFLDVMKQAGQGEINTVQLNNRLSQLSGRFQGLVKNLGPETIQALPEGMQNLLNASNELSRLEEKDIKRMKENQEANQIVSKGLLNFEQAITSVRSRLMAAFIQSEVFDDILTGFQELAKWASGKDSSLDSLFNSVEKYFDKFMNWLDDIFSTFKSDGLKAGFGQMFSEIKNWLQNSGVIDALSNAIAEAFKGAIGLLTGSEKAEEKAEKKRQKLEKWKAAQKRMDNEAGASLMRSSLGKEVQRDNTEKEVDAKVEELKGQVESLESQAVGLVEKLSGYSIPQWLTGIFGAGSAIIAGMWAFSKASGPAAAGLTKLAGGFAALTAGAGGILLVSGLLLSIGATVWMVGKGFQAAGAGANSFASSLTRIFENLEPGQLFQLSFAITAVAGSMAALAGSNILNSLSNWFTDSSPLERLLNVTKQFGKSDVENFVNVGKSLEKIADATGSINLQSTVSSLNNFVNIESNAIRNVRTFSDALTILASETSKVNSFSQGLSKLSSVTSNLDLTSLKDLKDISIEDLNSFGNIDKEALQKIERSSSGLANMSDATNKLNASAIREYKSAISELAEELKVLNQELGNTNQNSLLQLNNKFGQNKQNNENNENNNQQQDRTAIQNLNNTARKILNELQTIEEHSKQQLKLIKSNGNMQRGV